jgi:hypothetical protein
MITPHTKQITSGRVMTSYKAILSYNPPKRTGIILKKVGTNLFKKSL